MPWVDDHVVLDRVDDPITTYTDPVSRTVAQGNCPGRPRVQNVRPLFHNECMASEAAVRAFEAIDAAIAVLRAEVVQPGCGTLSDTDPLAAVADGCLDILAGVARTEARVAALKAAAAATYADSARSAAPPDMPVQAQEMAIAPKHSSEPTRRTPSSQAPCWPSPMHWQRPCHGPWQPCRPERFRGSTPR